jgi:hypothetical protein
MDNLNKDIEKMKASLMRWGHSEDVAEKYAKEYYSTNEYYSKEEMVIKKLCNVIMFPANEKASRIHQTIKSDQLVYFKDPVLLPNSLTQHLYITSDDKIEEGDWFIDTDGVFQRKNSNLYSLPLDARKIIATTDESLKLCQCRKKDHKMSCKMEWSLPEVSEFFIKEFVESQGKIKEVFVEYYRRGLNSSGVDVDLTGGIIVHQDDYYVVKTVQARPSFNFTIITSPAPEKTYTRKEVIAYSQKVFELVFGRVTSNKEDKIIENNL